MPDAVLGLRRLRWLPRHLRLAALESGLRATRLEDQGPLLEALADEAASSRAAEALRLMCLWLGRAWEGRDAAEWRGRDLLGRVDDARVSSAVDVLLASDDAGERAAGAALIGALPLPAMADRLPVLLAEHAGEGDVAERALVRLVDRGCAARAEGRSVALGPAGEALERALERFGDHRRSGILDLAATLVSQGVRLRDHRGKSRIDAPGWMGSEHAAGLAIRRLLRRDQREAVAAAAWAWLGEPSLASAALQRLTGPGAGLSRVLARAHLAYHPARWKALRRVVAPDGSVPAAVVPPAVDIAAMPVASRRAYPMWIAALGLPVRLADAAWGSVLADADAGVRHAAVRAAANPDGRAMPGCLVDFAFDADARVARSAALGLVCRPDRAMVRDPLQAGAMAALVRSAHPEVASIARASVVPDAVEAPDSPAARLALRRELAIAPDRVVGRLRGELGGKVPGRAAGAASLARMLGLVPRVTDALVLGARGLWLAAASADDAVSGRALARMLSVLAEAPGEAAAQVLVEGAAHPDARVRANAIDALARRFRLRLAGGTEGLAGVASAVQGLLRERVEDAAHRPRASAARALLVAGTTVYPRAAAVRDAGETALLAMLEDDRPMHRVAGLWLAERAASRVAPLPEIVEAVARLARVAGDGAGDAAGAAGEGARAKAAARRLLAEVRFGWSQRAASVETSASREREAVA